ncbi:MAG: hypothetical protein UW42_C0056G0006 [Candidatus Collierbacteria bacterium GW2011_GWB1_44_197]|nr:MAG: hypothetical protein UW42_C0056G0006 [Candidatus Collierbacteria bacterium GW2011_GWB1_44_197]
MVDCYKNSSRLQVFYSLNQPNKKRKLPPVSISLILMKKSLNMEQFSPLAAN